MSLILPRVVEMPTNQPIDIIRIDTHSNPCLIVADTQTDTNTIDGKAFIGFYGQNSHIRLFPDRSLDGWRVVGASSNILTLPGGIYPLDNQAQVLTGAGAVDLISRVTHVVTTGTDALTLADGTEGQPKTIVMKTDGGVGTLTPTSLANGTTITFDDVGDSAELMFTNGAWHFMGGTATLA